MLNTMCNDCAKLGKECQGTECQTWTGCVFRVVDNSKRIYNHYKSRIIRESQGYPIRFNCIQHLCSFPKLPPVEMAADLLADGFCVVFDDSSISRSENNKHKKTVYKALELRTAGGA